MNMCTCTNPRSQYLAAAGLSSWKQSISRNLTFEQQWVFSLHILGSSNKSRVKHREHQATAQFPGEFWILVTVLSAPFLQREWHPDPFTTCVSQHLSQSPSQSFSCPLCFWVKSRHKRTRNMACRVHQSLEFSPHPHLSAGSDLVRPAYATMVMRYWPCGIQMWT